MRIFYCIVFFVFCLSWSGTAQSREDYEMHNGRVDGKSIHIFPNPAVDFVHVRLDNLPARQVTLSLHNIIGNEIKVETEVVADNELRIRVKELDAGYYLLAIKDQEEHFRGTFKFIKR